MQQLTVQYLHWREEAIGHAGEAGATVADV